jgi:hypothetical protein
LIVNINGNEVWVGNGQYAVFSGPDLVGGKDWNGQYYKADDWVIYAVGAGHGQMIAYGQILKLDLKEDYSDRLEYRVQVLTHRTSGSWGSRKRLRPAFVNPMNITALTPDQQKIFHDAMEEAHAKSNP